VPGNRHGSQASCRAQRSGKRRTYRLQRLGPLHTGVAEPRDERVGVCGLVIPRGIALEPVALSAIAGATRVMAKTARDS
jgi:hypothetical protein